MVHEMVTSNSTVTMVISQRYNSVSYLFLFFAWDIFLTVYKKKIRTGGKNLAPRILVDRYFILLDKFKKKKIINHINY